MGTARKAPDMRAKEPKSVRILNQYRDRRGFSYELMCSSVRVVLNVYEREASDDPHAWHVDARIGGASASSFVRAGGDTRTAALAQLVEHWAPQAPLDWDAVTAALTMVRAL